MNYFIELAGGKASAVIRAMCDGLEEAAQRPDFKIDMSTYGLGGGRYRGGDEKTCFGCAATCTVMKISGKRFTVDNINDEVDRAEAVGLPDYEYPQLSAFEQAVDSFRRGRPDILLRSCGLRPEDWEPLLPECPHPELPWYLSSNDWQSDLPKIREFADNLEAAGY